MAEASDGQTAGVLLCQAAGIGVAFHAASVVGIHPCAADADIPSLRGLLGLSPSAGRAVMGADNCVVAVDSVEIWAEEVTLLHVPPMLRGKLAGGSLTGFVQAKERLWPLFGIEALAKFLRASSNGEGE